MERKVYNGCLTTRTFIHFVRYRTSAKIY